MKRHLDMEKIAKVSAPSAAARSRHLAGTSVRGSFSPMSKPNSACRRAGGVRRTLGGPSGDSSLSPRKRSHALRRSPPGCGSTAGSVFNRCSWRRFYWRRRRRNSARLKPSNSSRPGDTRAREVIKARAFQFWALASKLFHRIYWDRTLVEDPLTWTLEQFETGKLPAMIERAGYPGVAADLDVERIASVLPAMKKQAVDMWEEGRRLTGHPGLPLEPTPNLAAAD